MAGEPDYSELQRKIVDGLAVVAKRMQKAINAACNAFRQLTIGWNCNRRSRRAAERLNFFAASYYANDHIQRHIRWCERRRNDEPN